MTVFIYIHPSMFKSLLFQRLITCKSSPSLSFWNIWCYINTTYGGQLISKLRINIDHSVTENNELKCSTPTSLYCTNYCFVKVISSRTFNNLRQSKREIKCKFTYLKNLAVIFRWPLNVTWLWCNVIVYIFCILRSA